MLSPIAFKWWRTPCFQGLAAQDRFRGPPRDRGKAKAWFESRIRDFSDNVSKLSKKEDSDSVETELKVRNSMSFHINPECPFGVFL